MPSTAQAPLRAFSPILKKDSTAEGDSLISVLSEMPETTVVSAIKNDLKKSLARGRGTAYRLRIKLAMTPAETKDSNENTNGKDR